MTDYIENIKANNVTYPIGGTNFDGQWSTNSTQILSNSTLRGGSYIPYDLSNYLPNDSYDYEVTFVGVSTSVATSGKTCQLTLFSGTTSTNNGCGYRLNRCQARTAATTRAGGTVIIPIYYGDRNVTVWTQDCDTNNTGIYFKAVGYRRIGNNRSFKNLYAWYNSSETPDIIYTSTDNPTTIDKIYDSDGHLISKFNGYGASANSMKLNTVSSSSIIFVYYPGPEPIFVTYTRQSSDDTDLNPVSNINSYPIGGNNFNGEVTMFTTDQSSLSVGSTNSDEHNMLFETTIVKSSNATFSVANVIPNDGYDYELCISVLTGTPSTSGRATNLTVVQGTHTTRPSYDMTVGYRIARTGARYADFKTVWLPISANDKNITFFNVDGTATTTYNCMIHGYRRIGKND